VKGTNPDVAVTAIEPDQERAAVIPGGSGLVTVHRSTFEDYAAEAHGRGETFAAVVMNPPFAVPDRATIWIDHVRLAWGLLRPGARLVAIIPRSGRYRVDQRHRAIRDLAAACGRLEDLPRDAFAAAGTSVAASVLSLVKPLPATHPGEPYVWRAADPATEPVPVATPRLTAEAVTHAPVQAWHDAWRGRDRVLRFRAQCVTCRWFLWGFDDGENDPRGVLGHHSAGFSLDAADYDRTGPSIGLCPICANTRNSHEVALTHAYRMWSDHADPPPETDANDGPQALFDLPAQPPAAAPSRPLRRGRR
jgi:hypothetical protein